MRTYLKEELERFLEAVDGALTRPVEVIVIGGTAAALHYGLKHPTRDIDTWNALDADLTSAVRRAQATTGLQVPVAKSAVAEAPEDFEVRLVRVLPRLTRLVVRVPEKHDLVLMKTIRGDEHDLQAAEEIHANSPLDLEILVRRFEKEMDPIGPHERFRGHFLALVERLFPEAVDGVFVRLKSKQP